MDYRKYIPNKMDVKQRARWDIEAETFPKINPKIRDLNFTTLA